MSATIKAKKTEYAVFALLTIIILIFTLASMPVRHGDGHEYSLISQAFIDRQTPFFSDAEIEQKINEVNHYPSIGYNVSGYNRIKEMIDTFPANVPPNYCFNGIFRSRNGQFYSYHFWMYSLYSSVVEKATSALGANPLSGFQIANGLLFIFAIAYCLFFVDASLEKRLLLVAAFLLGGSVFYLKWTHPDVFIATFLFVGFIGLFQRRLYVALPCIAIAASQVVTIYTAYAAILLMLALVYRKGFFGQILILMKSWWAWAFAILPSVSFIFYKVNFDSWNLIGDGWVNWQLFSFSHFLSFWFDLDQGAFVGAPFVLIAIIVFLVFLRKTSRDCRLDFIVALFGSICICLPVLVHVGVNPGQSVFLRNSLYAVSPLVAWAGFYYAEVFPNRIVGYVVLLLGALHIAYFYGPYAKEDQREHKSWTIFLLNNYPAFYNQEPGIFFTRTNQKNGEWRINYYNPAIYYDNNGTIRKILLRVDCKNEILSNLGNDALVDEAGTPASEYKPKSVRYGWGYITGKFHFIGVDYFRMQFLELHNVYNATLADGIDFRRDGFPSFVQLAAGISGFEKWGRWTNASACVIKFSIKLPSHTKVKITVSPYDDNLDKPVKVNLCGIEKEFIPNDRGMKEYEMTFDIPANFAKPYIIIQPAHPHSPKSIGKGDDNRPLGLAIEKIMFEAQ
jgi:hypothetical protein